MTIAALVRVSSDQQDTKRQESDILKHTKSTSEVVALWFRDKESRDMPTARPDFLRMMDMVKTGKLKKVIIQEFNRFGTSDFIQFCHYAEFFRIAGCALVSVAEGDLLSKQVATQIQNFFRADASSTEQHKKGTTSLDGKRERVEKNAGPVGGPTLYGFDKACYSPASELLWTFTTTKQQPVVGVVRNFNSKGEVVSERVCEGKEATPRKSKGDTMRYVLSHDTDRIATVRFIFATFTTQNISSQRLGQLLNERGTTFYGNAWSPQTVEAILRNEKYCGNWTAFKTSAGRFGEFKGGRVVSVPEDVRSRIQYEVPTRGKKRRIVRHNDPETWMRKDDTHTAIIDHDTFGEAQNRLSTRKTRGLPPRKTEHYLKGLLFCAACGREMWVANSGEQLRYECQTYSTEYRTLGGNAPKTCSRNLVAHAEAETMIRAKLAELKAVLNPDDPDEALAGVFATLQPVVVGAVGENYDLLESPVFAPSDRDGLLNFLRERFPGKTAAEVLVGLGVDPSQAADDRKELAQTRVVELTAEFTKWVNAKVHADSAEERAVISAKLKDLRAELDDAKEAAKPPQTLCDVFITLQQAVADVDEGGAWADKVKTVFDRIMVAVDLKKHGERQGKDLFRYVLNKDKCVFVPKSDVSSVCSRTSRLRDWRGRSHGAPRRCFR